MIFGILLMITKKKAFRLVHKKEVVKTANTIAKLCDDFIIMEDKDSFALACYDSGDKTFYIKNTDEEVSLSECLRYEYELYGAIWIKGEHGEPILKAVAKLDDKGVLELL